MEEVELMFKETQVKQFKEADADDSETIEKGHGRVEIRKSHFNGCTALTHCKRVMGLKSIGKAICDYFNKQNQFRNPVFHGHSGI